MASKRELLIGIVSALLGAVGVVFVGAADYLIRGRELDIKMVEIALGILREEPDTSQLNAARGWAVDIINGASPIHMNEDVKSELIHKKLNFTWPAWPAAATDKTPYDLSLPQYQHPRIMK